MADKQISQLVAATTVNDDDLLVLQQGGTAKKLSGKKLGDYVYAAAAEKVAEVEEIVAEAQAAVDDLEDQKDEIAQSIASMAQLGTDTTLSTPGMAADAAATGEVKDIALASESMIAGVERTMEATQNYTEGNLVIAVHNLYHIDSNIASGETLVPGTNCHITTIADERSTLGNVSTLTYQVVT